MTDPGTSVSVPPGLRSISVLCGLVGLAACAAPQPAFLAGPVPLATDSARVHEPVWTAALLVYRKRTWSTEADELARESRRPGDAQEGRAAPLVLMSRRLPGQEPYRAAWLDSLVSQGIVESVCHGRTPLECPRADVAEFLTLGDPTYLRALDRRVPVHEEAFAPGACATHPQARIANTTLGLNYGSQGWLPTEGRRHRSRRLACAELRGAAS